jgi:hypothetical protein
MLTADPSREPVVLSPEQIELVHHHLEEVLASHAFAGSRRTQDFLRLIVGHALHGEFDSLRERMIGAEMFGRPVSYDTGSDSVVRVKATEVRKKLAQYYIESKQKPDVRIELPSGSYVPRFCFEHVETAEPPAAGKISPTPAALPSPATGDGKDGDGVVAQGVDPFRTPARNGCAGPFFRAPFCSP